ncbi:exodeoxyribonuclease V subunit gamma [Pseudokineococcus basanitobsidens]|uniref:RecBCD enzyme subunit RecC n=1 Tax=Pseudokineococcus basanitobsidens TaxID=1926649 RepID=A0ABU8RGH2_9ACTN
MALVVHRSEDAGALVAGLADVLAVPPDDPFARDVVAVPAQGVERWITQRLSHRLGARPDGPPDGVCARVDFPRPGRVLDDAVAGLSDEHRLAVERWAPQRSRWTLLDVLAEGGDTGPLAGAVADEDGRRLAAVHRTAGLFAAYGRARPAMLRAWAANEQGAEVDTDGAGAQVPDDLRWQPRLWRRLHERLGESPAEQLEGACRLLVETPDAVDLPARLSVYGATRLSPARLAVLAALAAGREVHLWLHHASPAMWAAVAASPPTVLRRDDRVRRALADPLLGSLGRDLLELQQVLRRTVADAGGVWPAGGTGVATPATGLVVRDEHLPPPARPGPPTLLRRLQRGLAADEVPADPPPLATDDRSVQVHACFGRTRQVEVLREVVVGLLADDPTLEPRDVVVMCPDVEAYAPLVVAAFGAGAEEDAEGSAPALAHPAARVRVRVADRAPRRTNPLLQLLALLLPLGASRVEASAVLDLAAHPAVRRRFGLAEEDLERLRDWAVGAGVRWGLDADHRAGWGLRGLRQGTWRAGLDRLLLGAAVEARAAGDGPSDGEGDGDADGDVEELLGGVVPLDDVDSADVDLAGRLAEMVDRLDAAVRLLGGRHDVATWAAGLEDAVLGLAAPDADGPWQPAQLHRELADVAEAAAGSTALLGLADVRVLLDDLLAGRPTRAGFRTGALTVCTLVPMRSVPSRVVVLLGLDDGVFPRRSARDGDDLLARDPWTGEHDPRSEDRQLLLDAVAAAQERLLLVLTGADERSGRPVPPAVPVDELLDALDRTATTPGGRVRDAVTTRHPLQPFDPRAFEVPVAPGSPGAPARRPFSFDAAALGAARAAAGERHPPAPVLAGPLPPTADPPSELALVDLRALLVHPARGFLRQRLGVALTRPQDEPDDALPVALDQLDRWGVRQRLLERRVAGDDVGHLRRVELQRGELPPGPLGERVLAEAGREAEEVVRASAPERAEPAGPVDVEADVAGVRLVGTVTGVRGRVTLRVTASRLGARHRLEAWLDLLALSAGAPRAGWRAVAVGRGGARVVLGPLDEEEARTALAELVGLHRAGLLAPLPLPLRTGFAYAERRRAGRSVDVARRAAAQEWEGGTYPGENAEAEHVLLHGAGSRAAVLWGTPSGPDDREPGAPGVDGRAPDESGPGWSPDERDRFGALARRLWDRVLDAEAGGGAG